MISEMLKDARCALAPILEAGHWALLVIDGDAGKVKAMCSLDGDMPDAAVAMMKKAMFNVAGVPGWSWLTLKGIGEAERSNLQRQSPMDCAFFACHWLETEVRRCEGQGPWSKGRCEVRSMELQLVKMLEALLPVEQK